MTSHGVTDCGDCGKAPVGGAHADPAEMIRRVGDALEDELKKLMNLSPDALRDQRAARYYAIRRA